MHFHFTQGPERTRDLDRARLEATLEETQEGQEEGTREEEVVLETPSLEDSWREEEELNPEQRERYHSYSMVIAPKQGCSSGP